MTPRALRDRVVQNIRTHALWMPDESVVIGVSGGRDSVVLLDVLHRTQGLHGGRLSVLTVDHGVRSESAEDACFVESLATERGLPVRRVTASLGPSASEAQCRAVRRSALLEAGGDVIALGHHARDHAETLLLRLMRGTGPRGVGGMAPRSGVWVRPLLDIAVDDVAAYADATGLAWREDPSNQHPGFLRNRVRHQVLPLLESLRRGSVASLARSARLAREESDWLDGLVASQDPWSCAFLADAPAPLVRRAVLIADRSLAHVHVDALRALASRGTGQIQLPDGRLAIAEGGRVCICPGERVTSLTDSPTATGGA